MGMGVKARHGQAQTPEYRIWSQIKNACYNPRAFRYQFVGAKGLEMQSSWAADFTEFLKDVGPRPSTRSRISRRDPGKGFFRGNVYWKDPATSEDVPILSSDLTPKLRAKLQVRLGKLVTLDCWKSQRNDGKSPRFKVRGLCDCGGTRMLPATPWPPKATSCGCDVDRYKTTTGEQNYQFTGYREIRGAFWNGYKESALKRCLPFEISLEYAWGIYEDQGRCCALSGVPIGFGPNRKNSLTTASIDRLDRSEGYVEGNIQWVHKTINLMRNVLSVEEFVDWCRLVMKRSQ